MNPLYTQDHLCDTVSSAESGAGKRPSGSGKGACGGQKKQRGEGSGAAGGLGFAFLAYLNGTLRSGAEAVMEATSLEEKIKCADILITGEGRFDHQSFMGKAPVEAARIAARHGKRVFVLAGSVSNDIRFDEYSPIDAVFPIVSGPCSLDEAMSRDSACRNMARTAEQIFRLLKAMGAVG